LYKSSWYFFKRKDTSKEGKKLLKEGILTTSKYPLVVQKVPRRFEYPLLVVSIPSLRSFFPSLLVSLRSHYPLCALQRKGARDSKRWKKI